LLTQAVQVASIEETQNDNKTIQKKAISYKKNIWDYNNKGIRMRKLKQLLRKADEEKKEESIEEELVTHIKRIIEVFKHYHFTSKEIEKLFFVKPRLLELSKTNLTKRFRSFASLELPYEVIKGMVLKFPGILLMDSEVTLQNRMNVLQELNLLPKLNQQRCLYLIQKCPQLLSVCDNKKDLQEKIKMFEEYGLHEQQIFELIMKHPSVLTANKESLKTKINYLTNEMNGRIGLVVKFPRFLTTSIVRLQQRNEYLIHEGYLTTKTILTENKLRSIVLTTDSDFIYRITQTKMKDYRKFQKDFYSDTEYVEEDMLDENIEEELENNDNASEESGTEFENFLEEYNNLKK